MIKLEVTPNLAGKKISDCIKETFTDLNKPKRMIRQGDVRINGDLAKKDYIVEDGDVIELHMPVSFERPAMLSVAYEDKNIIVVNKQPGTVVAGKADNTMPDIMSMVINYMKEKQEYSEEAGYIPFPCFKLDLYTGGLVLFVKHGDFFETMRTAINQRRVKRYFQAAVRGCPQYDQGELQHFYAKDGENKYRVSTKKISGAVPIYTKYDVLKTNGTYSLLEIEPVTQYMNQERAHLEAAGYPILGDPVFGDARLNKKLGLRQQVLWATKIVFHTGTNNVLEYLNGMTIETKEIDFPVINFAKDTEEA